MFRLAHTKELLESYAKAVTEEWPEFLAKRYHALTLHFDRTVRQIQNGANLCATRLIKGLRGATAALVLPSANTEAFSLHLAEISKEVASGAHAILTLDGAGYHAAAGLKTPDNITLLPLPYY